MLCGFAAALTKVGLTLAKHQPILRLAIDPIYNRLIMPYIWVRLVFFRTDQTLEDIIYKLIPGLQQGKKMMILYGYGTLTKAAVTQTHN